MREFSLDAKNSQRPSITPDPEEVAQKMVTVVEYAKYLGGTCLEVTSGGSRVMRTWNIEAPQSNITAAVREATYAPALAIMKKERGV